MSIYLVSGLKGCHSQPEDQVIQIKAANHNPPFSITVYCKILVELYWEKIYMFSVLIIQMKIVLSKRET